MRIIVLILINIGLISTVSFGQDPIFSQFFVNPSLVNPAFTGNTYGAYVTTQVRVQWLSHENPYNTAAVSYSQQINKASGLGIAVTSDRAGDGLLFSNKISGLYSFKVSLNNDTYLKSGIELAYVNQRLDEERLIFYDNLDPRYGAVTPGGTVLPTAEVLDNTVNQYLDMSVGLLVYNPKYYGGLSIKHVNRPSTDFIDNSDSENDYLPFLFSLQGGTQIDLGSTKAKQIFVAPNALVAFQAGTFQALGGAYVNYDAIFGGLWYRHAGNNSDAVIAMIGAKYGIFKISYSFDYTVSGLTIGSGGAHEIGVALNFEEIRPKRSRYSDCFEIFR